MFSRLQRSWDLSLACMKLLLADKSLLVFPLMSGVATALIVASFAVPLAAVGGILRGTGVAHSLGVLSYVALFAFYWLQFSIVIYFNAALVEVALRRMDGKEAGIADGLRRATSLLPTILAYALIAATVGTLLRFIAERVGFLGRIVVGLIGLAWTIATALVVPVLVAEEIGPVDVISRSTQLIKKAWGETLIGNAGIGLVFGLLMVLLVAVAISAEFIASSIGSPALGLLIVVAAGVTFIMLVLTQSTLQGIYTAALYRYASGDGATPGIDKGLLESAFRPKT
ncbi:MAG: DUF6159 family protein [Casimicrobiaceae bacterium]